MHPALRKDKLARFGRSLALLLNKSLMYQANHPFLKQSVSEVLAAATPLLETISPLVFILTHGQFYIDEDMLDPRINIKRTAALWENNGLQSISFEKGLMESELIMFSELFAALNNSSLSSLKQSLIHKGIFNIKVNHVVLKKVSEDDQVVSRDALKQITPLMDTDDPQHRKQFMETLFESLLTEEFAKTLSITNMMANPRDFTQKMIEMDLSGEPQSGPAHDERAGQAGPGPAVVPISGIDSPSVGDPAVGNASQAAQGPATQPGGPVGAAPNKNGAGGTAAQRPGILLLQEIEVMHQEVEKQLQGNREISLSDLAQSVFEMKKQLLEGLQAQKALGIAYANEAAIRSAANKLTDQVLVELIREEYKSGAITTQRLALLIVRIIPEADELKRLLPQIKTALLQQGMSAPDYLKLIYELRDELQSEELARVLQASSESAGLDGGMLIEEVKRNPKQAAELIYLASEIRRGGGDENALSDLLVEYIERLGHQMAAETAAAPDGEAHLKQVMTDIESTILKKLSQTNTDAGMLQRMEERLNARMESILDDIRVQWLQKRAAESTQPKSQMLSVLQTLEHNVSGDEELAEILRAVRAKVDEGEVDENNFRQIHEEIERLKISRENEDEHTMPDNVLTSEEIMFELEKEIARVKRYGLPFSALALAFVEAKPMTKSQAKSITQEAVYKAALEKLAATFREVDDIGRIGKSRILVLLPMTYPDEGKQALARILRLLHAEPLDVGGIPVQLRAAGVSSGYEAEKMNDARSFAQHLHHQLTDLVARIKNIQVLF